MQIKRRGGRWLEATRDIWLHRELQDNPLWNSEPFSKGQAWVDMLLRANHQRNEFIIGNELIVVERGQFFTSELKLAEKWKWSRKKVRAYLSLLKTLKMATTVGTSKGTMVTIENYAYTSMRVQRKIQR